MIIDNPINWRFTSGGWEKLFLPLSDTCTSYNGENVLISLGGYNVDYDKSSTYKCFPRT